MNEKFTKGEWFVQGDFIKSIKDGQTKNICNVFGRPQDIMMDGKTEARANADLISAAPEMYELLKEIDDVGLFKPESQYLQFKIQEVLKTATGNHRR